MSLKRKSYTPQEYIRIGMAFFLMGLFVNQVVDGRMIGYLLIKLLHDQSLMNGIQGFSAGLSIPISCISIYFNLRGLIDFRSR